jgi:uracil-DNA glycosylase
VPKFKMMLVGEAWGQEEAAVGLPFVGSSGKVLDMLLRTVGIPRNEIYLTNVFNRRPSEGSNDLSHLCGPKAEALQGYPALTSGKYVRREFAPELARLFQEIERERPNVVIAAGATPAWALLGVAGIRKVRGAPSYASGTAGVALPGVKVLPTYHPSAVMREWKLRPIVMADLAKAVRESEFPEIRRPRREFWIEPTIADLYEFEARFITPGCDLSIDIETANGQVTCIGFAPNPQIALVVPFVDPEQSHGNYWRTRNEEVEAWKFVKRLCETHPSLGQNFAYDMHYLWRVYGIRCFRMKDDTMLMHHALQPEMEKGLGFLGSVYTDEPAWKFMRAKHETLKKED